MAANFWPILFLLLSACLSRKDDSSLRAKTGGKKMVKVDVDLSQVALPAGKYSILAFCLDHRCLIDRYMLATRILTPKMVQVMKTTLDIPAGNERNIGFTLIRGAGETAEILATANAFVGSQPIGISLAPPLTATLAVPGREWVQPYRIIYAQVECKGSCSGSLIAGLRQIAARNVDEASKKITLEFGANIPSGKSYVVSLYYDVNPNCITEPPDLVGTYYPGKPEVVMAPLSRKDDGKKTVTVYLPLALADTLGADMSYAGFFAASNPYVFVSNFSASDKFCFRAPSGTTYGIAATAEFIRPGPGRGQCTFKKLVTDTEHVSVDKVDSEISVHLQDTYDTHSAVKETCNPADVGWPIMF